MVPATDVCRSSSPDRDVFDYALLCERVNGKQDLVEQLIDLLLADYPTHRAAIEDSLSAGDARALQDAAHRFKGQLQTLSVNAAARVALKLERLGRDGDVPAAADALPELLREMDRFIMVVATRRERR
jgi:HPt (histidine-containing phosphotransfer) domain-containing protein